MPPTASIPVTLAAAAPIAAIVLLMIWRQWSAAKAGGLGLVIAMVVAFWTFGFGRTVYSSLGPFAALVGVVAEAAWVAATILWIIFPALCIHHLQLTSGALDVLRRFMGRLSTDPRIVVLLVAWFFSLFIEGAAGFGTTVALAAPFLVTVGFKPTEAVTAALVGHVVGVSFGAVGTPIVPQMAATGADALDLARVNALYHMILGGYLLLMMMAVTMRSLRQRDPQARMPLGWIALAALFFLMPYAAIAWCIGPELPSIGGAVVGGLAFVALVRSRRSDRADEEVQYERMTVIIRAAAPYVVLIALILITRLIVPLRAALNGYAWDWQLLDYFKGNLRPLYHPGTMLMLAFLAGGFWQRVGRRETGNAMVKAALQLRSVTLALLAMLTLSRLMVHATMIDTLAVAAAAMAGPIWPLAAPYVGVLGTFVTGSATASNILFCDFQQATATNLKLPTLVLTGAQGFGAAVGNMICPHNIIAGGATVGIAGQEGVILRRTLLPCLIYTLLGGVLALILARAGVFAETPGI